MFDFSIANIMASNLFNFIIMIGLFVYIFMKIKSSNVGKKTEIEIIKEKMDNSENSKNDSYVVLEQVEDKLENSQNEVENILNNASKSAEEFLKKAEIDAQKQIEEIEQNRQKSLSNEIQRIKNQIRKELAIKSIEKTANKFQNKLKENPNLHQKFIDEAIEKISEANL